jgi:hypothetical protein
MLEWRSERCDTSASILPTLFRFVRDNVLTAFLGNPGDVSPAIKNLLKGMNDRDKG